MAKKEGEEEEEKEMVQGSQSPQQYGCHGLRAPAYGESASNSSRGSSIQRLLNENLSRARHCSRVWDTCLKKHRDPCPRGAHSPVGKPDTIKSSQWWPSECADHATQEYKVFDTVPPL